MTPEITTWFALGYGALLVLVAYGIDRLAKRAQSTIESQRSGGFVYHEDHDAWVCPEDQWLYPKSFDPDNRVMRYRGLPVVCNACPVKESCTASDDGREVQRHVDTWPASESARFHRGIACAVTVLAVAWPAVAALAVDLWIDRLVLLVAAVLIALVALPLWSHLRRTPTDPYGVFVQTLDDTLAERRQTAEALARRRTSYASDRRKNDAP